MSFLPKALMLVAVLGVAACNNPNRFGAGGGAGDGAYGAGGAGGVGGAGYGGVGTSGLGDPNDPNSQAYFSQRVGDRILFDYDQATLNDEGRQVLSGQAQWLNTHPNYALIVEGHADEKGTREYNLALGARRASSAQDFLISQGVQAGRVRTVSYGKERPASVCSEESCYAQNRRAVTVLQQGAGS